MKSTRNLRLRLRLIEGALVLLTGALTTGAVATHQLLLDANNHPTGNVSLSGVHWTDTLSAERLPGDVNFSSIGGGAPGYGAFNTLSCPGPSDLAGGVSAGAGMSAGGTTTLDSNADAPTSTDGTGGLNVGESLSVGGNPVADAAGNVTVAGTLYVTGVTGLDGGQITTNGYGGLFTGGGLHGSRGFFTEGFRVWGGDPPDNQPATPTNQAQIIAVLQAYGLCH